MVLGVVLKQLEDGRVSFTVQAFSPFGETSMESETWLIHTPYCVMQCTFYQ